MVTLPNRFTRIKVCDLPEGEQGSEYGIFQIKLVCNAQYTEIPIQSEVDL